MRKKVLNICMAVLLAALCCFHTGCGFNKYLSIGSEEEIYNQTVDEFFQALDARDKEAIKDMFAPAVRKKDKTFDDSVDKLLECYSGPTDICKRDGSMAHGSYSMGEISTSEVDSGFPVVSNGKYYWCDFTLMYANNQDKDEIGIKKVRLVSVEYECEAMYAYAAESRAGMMDKGGDDRDESALQVFTECDVDYEVRFIGGYPEKFTPVDRELSLAQVEKFFETSHSYSEFVEEFGEPNVPGGFSGCSYIYELSDEGAEPRYLAILLDSDGDAIYSARVKNDLDVSGILKVWSIKDMEEE
ncbi:MAG: DUF5104 domain-containing protein [Lachnospiraceae bacterium]|nr:DUF5104 domain-containing protein [Lachnospiraceae bacterium]